MLRLIGTDHTRASVALRERLSFAPAAQRDWLALARLHGMVEGVLLSTCNRTEAYLVCDQAVWPVLRAWLVADWARRCGRETAALEALVQGREGADAARHLFRVAAGLESILLGEGEIVAQVKTAYATARLAESVGPRLHGLFQAALGAGRQARRQTALGREALAPGAAAVILAAEAVGDLAGRSAWVWGSGTIGRPLVQHLAEAGAEVTVSSRTAAHAERAAGSRGRVRPWAERLAALAEADVLVTAVGGAGPWLRAADVVRAMAERDGRALFVLDFGVPRNSEEGVAAVAGVSRRGVDDLRALVERGRARRARAAREATAIVDAALEAYVRGHQERRAAPLIRSLYSKAEVVRAEEVARTLRRLPGLGQAERAAIERLSRRLVGRLLNDPALALRSGAGSGDPQSLLDAAVSLFGLGNEADGAGRN